MEGIQHHVLWQMDGRTWVEVLPEKQGDIWNHVFAVSQEKGWATIIPAPLMAQFVKEVVAYDAAGDNPCAEVVSTDLATPVNPEGACRVCGNPSGACEVPGACL